MRKNTYPIFTYLHQLGALFPNHSICILFHTKHLFHLRQISTHFHKKHHHRLPSILIMLSPLYVVQTVDYYAK